MEVNVLKDEKDFLVVEMNNQTIAELVRVYLNKDSNVEVAVWKKEHPDAPVIFELKTKGKSAKKALDDAVSTIEKDVSKILDDFKKAK